MNRTPLADEMADEERAALLAAVEEGIADSAAGGTIPYERVRRWLLSWGSRKEITPPKCP